MLINVCEESKLQAQCLQSQEPGAYDKKQQGAGAVRMVHQLEESQTVIRKTFFLLLDVQLSIDPNVQSIKAAKKKEGLEVKGQRDTSQGGCAEQPIWNCHYMCISSLASTAVRNSVFCSPKPCTEAAKTTNKPAMYN